MTKTAIISPELLRQIIRFDGRDYFWNARPLEMYKTRRAMNAFNNRDANTKTLNGIAASHGYRQVRILNRAYLAHRVIWAFHYGEWPDGQIDHINGDKLDNRIENLRVVSQAENLKNKSLSTHNTSGYSGVTWDKKKRRWRARINGKENSVHLGYFANIEEAVDARVDAERKLGYHSNHGRI